MQALLCGERAIEGGDHIGSQPVAFALKVHIDRILRAAGDFDSGAAFAAQFQGLAEHHRGGAGFAPGVLGFPGQFRVGDQPGLLAFTLGDTHVPLRGRQLRVVGEGAVEGLVQGQRRSLRDGRQRSTEEHRGDEQDTGKGYQAADSGGGDDCTIPMHFSLSFKAKIDWRECSSPHLSAR
ncbi:hypothetical protein D3C78_963370 [compost metagenome]